MSIKQIENKVLFQESLNEFRISVNQLRERTDLFLMKDHSNISDDEVFDMQIRATKIKNLVQDFINRS